MEKAEIKRIILHGAVFVFLFSSTIWIYRHAAGYEFVNYDDPAYVYENPYIKEGLTVKNIIWAFTASYCSNWHPMTWIFHMIDIELFGLHAGSHHIVNVVIHLINACLVYILFYSTTGDMMKTAILAAFFALHPLHVESVAWISERKDLLCALFWLTGMMAYCHYVRKQSRMAYFSTVIFFMLSLMSKSMSVTFPLILLLFDFWPLKRHISADHTSFSHLPLKFWKKLLFEKAPLLALSLMISFAAIWTQFKGGSLVQIQQLDIGIRMANALSAYLGYIQKMVWPVNLSVFYPYEMPNLYTSLTGFWVIVCGIFIGIRWKEHHPYFLIGFLWYVVTLLPVIGIVQVGSQAMADRYMYMPSIGLSMIMIWGVYDMVQSLNMRYVLKKIILTGIIAPILVLLIWISSFQIRSWRNSISLMENALAVTQRNYIAHENLGLALIQKGLYEKALYHFKQAAAIHPKYADPYLNIGSYYFMRKEYETAIQYYKKAISLNQNLYRAYIMAGKSYQALGDHETAQLYFNIAKGIDPRDPDLR